MKRVIRWAAGKIYHAAMRLTDVDETTVVTWRPDGDDAPKDWVLLSYVIEPFLLDPGGEPSHHHTHDWESLQMARTFLDMGFGVDVISYRNSTFVPKKPYRLFIGARTNFEHVAEQLDESCIKVAHLDTAHWLVNNSNAYARCRDIVRRRNAALPLPRKVVEQNWAIERADYGTVLGNEFTKQSYAYAGKEIFQLPLPACCTFDWGPDKDFDAIRRNFVWFGSHGLVHKGLDLALDAFAGMPDYRLTVCGPVSSEPRFEAEYQRELYELPNIQTIGWLDIRSPRFREVMSSTLGLVYPSCSEGGGGSVITCMQAGAIPIVTRQASVDIDDRFGLMLRSGSVDAIRESVVELSSRPAEELADMSRRAWQTARERYTRDRYAQEFRALMAELLERDAGGTRHAVAEVADSG